MSTKVVSKTDIEAPNQSLLQLQISSTSIEICLGKTQQWTRMLRGQGQELRKVPGIFALVSLCENTASSSSNCSKTGQFSEFDELCEWQFEDFASRPNPNLGPRSVETSTSEEYYFAISSLAKLAPNQDPAIFAALRPVSQLSDAELWQSEFLRVLLHFLEKICQQPNYQQGILWDGLLWAKTGEQHLFLLLPPQLVLFITQRSSVELRLQHFIPYQLPTAPTPNGTASALSQPSNDQFWTYALAALLYYRLTGEQAFRPYPSDKSARASRRSGKEPDGERLHDAAAAMRHGSYIEAKLFRPDLSPAFNQLLRQTLCTPLAKTSQQTSQSPWPSLQDWRKTLFTEDNPLALWQDCDEQQRQQASIHLAQARKHCQKNWQLKSFWRKRNSLIAICSILLVLLGSMIYTPLKRALSPPTHSNRSAYETLSLYYQAIDALEPQQQSELSYKSKGSLSSDANMLTMLFVNVQTRKGYEGRDVLLKVANWLQEQSLSDLPGSPIPALSSDYLPYGITGLQIGQVAEDATAKAEQLAMQTPEQLLFDQALQDNTEVQLKAQYSLWLPGSFAAEENTTTISGLEQTIQAKQPLHQQVTDLVNLIYRKRKNAWYIFRIDRSASSVSHPLP